MYNKTRGGRKNVSGTGAEKEGKKEMLDNVPVYAKFCPLHPQRGQNLGDEE